MHPPSNSAVRTTRDKNKSRTKRAKRAKVTVSICIHRVTNREIIDIERREDRDRDRGEVVYISNNKQKLEKSATHPASRTSHAYTYDIYIYMYNIYIYIYKLYNLYISIRNIYLCTDCCVRGIYFRGIEYPRIQNQNFDHLRVTLFYFFYISNIRIY